MAQGTTVKILVGRLRGLRGQIVSVNGGVYVIAHAGGSTTFRARELEVVA